MAYADLREYMDALEKNGELVRTNKEVDWNLEIGAIARHSYEIGAPAIHATKIKGYPEGYSILAAPMGGSKKGPFVKLAIAMEMNPNSKYEQIVEEYLRRIRNPIKPILVSEGPCKENILLDKDINLFKFPAPLVHEGDGGRYMCTWHTVITQDPDSSWVNWGMYRAMIHRKNRLGGLVPPTQHIGMMYYQKYETRNQPMPFAICIGTEPITSFISATMVPAGMSEPDVVGAVRREPIELVKCETNDLYVPAHSEIVIEGEVLPHERWDEGPFGEFTGYRASPRMPRPVYRVSCITHRNDPVLTMSCMGVPVDESDSIMSVTSGAIVLDELREKKWPVKGVYMPPDTVHFMLIVSSKIPYSHFAFQLASAVWASKPGIYIPYLVVVEDDVDPTNMMQVVHALVTKCHPVRGIQKIDHAPAAPLTSFLNLTERQFGMGSNVMFDCTWPKDWDPTIAIPPKASFENIYPKEIQEKVLQRWIADYGFNSKE